MTSATRVADPAGLEFFNRLSGRLVISLSEAPVRITETLQNLAAPPTGAITAVSLELEVSENEDFRPLTQEELARVVLHGPTIKMRSDEAPEIIVEHRAPSGEGFTVADLVAAIAKTEAKGRPATEWFGGIDVHHVFFEGIGLVGDVWVTNWGS